MRDTRRFVESRLQDLGAVLNAEQRAAREAIAKHVRKIMLTPEGKTYVARETWDLLGWWQLDSMRSPGTILQLCPWLSESRTSSPLGGAPMRLCDTRVQRFR